MTPVTATTCPSCSQCGETIGANELLWRELPQGTVRASCAANPAVLQGRRLWHPACLPPDQHALAA